MELDSVEVKLEKLEEEIYKGMQAFNIASVEEKITIYEDLETMWAYRDRLEKLLKK